MKYRIVKYTYYDSACKAENPIYQVEELVQGFFRTKWKPLTYKQCYGEHILRFPKKFDKKLRAERFVQRLIEGKPHDEYVIEVVYET